MIAAVWKGWENEHSHAPIFYTHLCDNYTSYRQSLPNFAIWSICLKFDLWRLWVPKAGLCHRLFGAFIIKGEMEVVRRRGRRRKKLLDDLKDRRGYSHLKVEALDRTMWRHRFGGGFGPVVRQNTEWIKVTIKQTLRVPGDWGSQMSRVSTWSC